MFNKTRESEIGRLEFEKGVWIVLIFLGIANILGDDEEQEYLKTNDSFLHGQAKKIFTFSLGVSLIIYVYYFTRNYAFYLKATDKEKKEYFINFLGSVLLISATLCFLHFQMREESFEGTPSI